MRTKILPETGGSLPRPWLWLRILGIGLTLWLLFRSPRSGWAAPRVIVENPQVTYTFGEQIVFSATLRADRPIQQVNLFYHAQNLPYTLTAPMALDEKGQVLYIHDLHQQPLPAFTPLAYWFQVTLDDGQVVVTPPQQFLLEDNRFDWRTLESPPFVVYWYNGDAALAQQVMDAAQQALLRLQQQWEAPMPAQVDIYTYGSLDALQSALSAMPTWAAGHADPALGKIFLALSPGLEQGLEAQRQVPHELAHVLLYQATQAGYAHLPQWLNEGVASLAELTPNPEYEAVLQEAVARQGLLPLTSLCQGFPPQAGQAMLAYAESASFVRFLYHTYGTAGLRRLIEAYAQGQGCVEAPRSALGKSLPRLEKAWLASLGAARDWSWLTDLAPWLGLGLLILAPLGVVSLTLPRAKLAEEEG
ncbi:MAG TPA: hypothetical protein G4O04_11050 [Anaerolineae bacterium]|nr:hypothetical protein [Anaerolineae bacterium]HID85130.1 hypothetical protein [Anaerolineales bacterium]HIQ08239.1 hypothetical protein [Anaerolineaceae bacterium]